MTSEQPEVLASNHGQPGETLRKARETRGLALNDVAVSLNLAPVALKNLESGAFDRLPGHTFARGYIRAYAKLMGMDQDLLVREFDQVTGTDASGSSVNSLGRLEEPARLSQGLLRMVTLTLLIVLVLAGFLWWQGDSASAVVEDVVLTGGIEQVEVESADGTTQIHPLEPEDQAAELIEQQATELDLDAGTASAAPAEPSASPTPAVVPSEQAPAPEASAPTSTPADAVPAVIAVEPQAVASVAVTDAVANVTPVAGPGEGLLDIRFSANCWAQVTDAQGKVLFSALKRAGESISLAVKLPLELRLGYASGAQVAFNGKAVDITPYTTGETARLKLGL